MAQHPLSAQAQRGSGNVAPESIRVWLLGGFRVSVGSRTVEASRWQRRKAESLIKLLALAQGHRLHREQITNFLWPDLDAKSAANNLHRALHFARAALEPGEGRTASRYLALQGDMLTLCPDGLLWVDVEAFESAAASARRVRGPAAYRAAIELYAGDLLPEDRYESWAQDRRQEIRTVYLALLVELAALYEAQGKPAPAIEALQKVVSEDPAHEEAHAGLMRLYAGTGQRYRFLRQYEQLRQALRQELNAEPGARSKRLYQEILAGRIPAVEPPSSGFLPEGPPLRHNLPHSLTSFVGREREAAEVERLLLGTTRLLTLTGTGGSGKTRLALEVARGLVDAYPDGVWFVELASLAEGALVPQAVAAALGVSERPDRPLTDTLVNALREERMLLVLDNCEHLISACVRLLETLLGSCPDLRILATSREVLGLPVEATWPVPPLSGPPPGPAVEELEGYESVRLFVERARSREPGFVLSPENARAVAEICRRLDGIPLAIELAAARVGTLGTDRISERLSDSLQLLTGGSRTAARRQRTLRGALDWSYELLTEGEQKLFCRLSAFAGGWTLAAAEAVGTGDGIDESEVLQLLSGLVDKSLVETGVTGDGAVRFRMLEPVRQYAREILDESGEGDAVRRRHATFFLELAEEAEPELTTGAERRVAWLERLGTESGNFRAALAWMLEPEGPTERAELGLQMAAALWKFWNVNSLHEGRRWLQTALERSSSTRSAARARALNEAGYMASWQGDYERAMALLEESFALFEELGSKPGAAISLTNLGMAAIHGGDGAKIVSKLREEAEALRPQLSDKRASAYLLTFLAMAALYLEGDEARMVALHEESLALFREVEDVRGISMCLIPLGIAALKHGNPEKAAALLEEDLRLLRKLREKNSLIYNLVVVAGVATLRGEPARAARLWGAAQAFREATGVHMSPFLRSHYDYEGYFATARSRLDEAAFGAAFSEGQAMSPDQAIEYALSTEDTSPREAAVPKPRAPAPPDTLTSREREVADLIGRGFTNREIAAELNITQRTVETHVSKALRKLGFTSRTQIATWVMHQR